MNMSSDLAITESAELMFYRVLARFTKETWTNIKNAKAYAEQLSNALDTLRENGDRLSDELISHLAITINALICPDHRFLHAMEQLSLPVRGNYDRTSMEPAPSILYNILSRVNFDRVHRQINGVYFCTNPDQLYIYPRRPPRSIFKYTHHAFEFPTNSDLKHIEFLTLQHVVHNVDDVLSILNLRQSEPDTSMDQSIVAEFIGGPNHAYHGPPNMWFVPLPSEQKSSSNSSQFVCPSHDCMNSGYGCYRFTIPFTCFLKFKVYVLGTRQYVDEYCHSILFTDTNVKTVTFIHDMEPTSLIGTNIIVQTNGSYQWLCYWDTKKA